LGFRQWLFFKCALLQWAPTPKFIYMYSKSFFFSHSRPWGAWSKWTILTLSCTSPFTIYYLSQNPIKCNNSLLLNFQIFSLLKLLKCLFGVESLISIPTSDRKLKASSSETEDKVPKQVFIYCFQEAKLDKYQKRLVRKWI
jgi:hypothetical protein